MNKWIFLGSWLVAACNAEDIQITWVNNGRVCVNDVAILKCNSDQHTVPDWKIDGANVVFPNHMASRSSSNLNELHVNVTKSVNISCSVFLYENGQVTDSIPSKNLTVSPIYLPEIPVKKDFTIEGNEAELMVDHNSVCFGKHTFYAHVCLSENTTSTHHTVKRSVIRCFEDHFNESITIDKLSAGKNYSIAVAAVCQNESDIRSRPLVIDFTTQSAGKLKMCEGMFVLLFFSFRILRLYISPNRVSISGTPNPFCHYCL
jgi:hypothetical protein